MKTSPRVEKVGPDDLFAWAPPPPRPGQPTDGIDEAFRRFHRENPRVYGELVKLAKSLKAKGWKHYGIGALFEVIRFHRALETTDQDFKLNNNFRALYSRAIMEQNPDLRDFFETRVRTTIRPVEGKQEQNL